MLDEPSLGLMLSLSIKVIEILKRISSQGKTIPCFPQPPPFFLLNFNTNPFSYCKMDMVQRRVRSEACHAQKFFPPPLLKGGAGELKMKILLTQQKGGFCYGTES